MTRNFVPVDENGNELDEPMPINGWLVYPDGRMEPAGDVPARIYGTTIHPDGQLETASVTQTNSTGSVPDGVSSDAVRPGATTTYLTIGGLQASQQLTGTRELMSSYRISESTATTTGTKNLGAVTLGLLNSPPGKVPVLRVVAELANDTSGQTTTLEIGSAGRSTPLLSVSTTGTGTNVLYKEVYLNEETHGTAAGMNQFLKYSASMSVTGGTGTIYRSSTVGIEYEAI